MLTTDDETLHPFIARVMSEAPNKKSIEEEN